MTERTTRPRCDGSEELRGELTPQFDHRDPRHEVADFECPGCPDCGGDGSVFRSTEGWPEGTAAVLSDCARCDGTGVLVGDNCLFTDARIEVLAEELHKLVVIDERGLDVRWPDENADSWRRKAALIIDRMQEAAK